MRLLSCALFITFAVRSHGARDLGWGDDSDLTTFVTRPELKSQRFDITLYEPESVTPGYWFVAPYTEINQPTQPPKYYQACQTGPHIFDSQGELVYSGACQFKNQNACDFRPWFFNDTYLLSTILYRNAGDPSGRAVIMNSSYDVIREITVPSTEFHLNMHEFNIVDGGKSALYIAHRTEYVDITDLPTRLVDYGYIHNLGFREVDIESGATNFEWWAYPEVSIMESNVKISGIQGPYPNAWNWFHGNSVDKNSQGDYLISSRYTDTVYKISGKTGKIAWRLGGSKSDFQLSFNFSRQHDAHWIESECSETKEVITLLDNAGDEHDQSSEISSGIKIELDLERMDGHVVSRWHRPDQDRSQLRGNFQRLASGNWLAGWSDNAYFSEHTSDGRLVMEAEFASKRMVTYRTYKANFTGRPLDPPVIKAFVYGANEKTSTTVIYASWNGATDVDEWHFFNAKGSPLGHIKRQGFETRYFSQGLERQVYAQAVAVDGSILGQSSLYDVELPEEWTMLDSPSSRVSNAQQRLNPKLLQSRMGQSTPVVKTEL